MMLTFLRKIRKSLSTSGSTRRYFLYSIGEIFLVVVGILIALQINNWNQKRINRSYEKDYLERFVTDLERDSSLVALIMRFVERKKEGLRTVKTFLDDINTTMDDSVTQVILASTSMGTDLPNTRLNATYQEIISSGHLRLIRNTELRNNITTYYSFWDHQHFRIRNKESDYPSLVTKLIDRGKFFNDDPINQGKTLASVLNEYGIEKEFRMNFLKEVNYAIRIEELIDVVGMRVERLKSKIKEELDKI